MRWILLSFSIAALAVAGCRGPIGHKAPPAAMMMHPGPGVDGPGPGVLMPLVGPGCGQLSSSQVAFVGPESMSVQWDISAAGQFDSEPLVCPARYNFPQGAIYRLKLTNIPGRAGVELYPTIEVGPTLPRTEAFLAHNAIPFQLTEEDFDQVLSGNFVTKVIYLPDPKFQELALAGVETLVSTRLDPGVDPIIEADRRGSILAIIRMGNKDLQLPSAEFVENGVMQVGVPGAAPYPMQYVAGVSAPQYGMTMSGTPIGLPGPPHVPLGSPAGLQKHAIVNHTNVHMPQPSDHVRIDVRQEPGYSYPRPANHASIIERSYGGMGRAMSYEQETAPCPAPQ